MTPESANCELRQNLGASTRRRISRGQGRLLWCTNLAMLAVVVVWVLADSRFAATVQSQQGQVQALAGYTVSPQVVQLGPRVVLLWSILVVSVVTIVGIFVTLFAGSEEHRRLRSWLAFTMLVAAWLMLLVGWREFAWQGQRLRMRASLSEFDAIAASLRDDWPTADGERTGLGTFMAYPQGQPRVLMMLTSDTSPAVAAVERAEDGALMFDLQSESGGTWLEWHPAGSTPHAFIGGLEGEYDFRRAAPLGRGWYLVRYR